MNAVLKSADDGADIGQERQKRARLENLPRRQRLTNEQAAARSALVGRLRIILPAIAVALVIALVLNTRSGEGDDAFLDDFKNIEASAEELRMANPRFAGVDDKGHPYEITAEAALQAPGVQEIVDLVKPRAVTSGPDEETIVTANKGVFQSEANVLDLEEDVTLEHAIGGETYVLKTPAAKVSIKDETVESVSGVEGKSASGALRADNMRAYNSEGRVVFEGNVSMRIYPKKAGLTDAPKVAEEEPQ